MDRLTSARQRIAAACDLPDVLDAAYDAFEDMLAVLRRHQEDEESAFPAFVMAAAASANGRDWIAGAEALPPAVPLGQADDLPEGTTVADVARAVAALSAELATRLTAAGSIAEMGNRLCCEGAAAEAATITALLGGANPP